MSFNQSLDAWNMSNVSDISFMFEFASSFNQSLLSWKFSKTNVTNYHVFYRTDSFNQDVDNWSWYNHHSALFYV